ncbi:MAG: hypothetical protein HOO06_11500 [Bdellovibrionaceae bacterium]|jgi:hypothetical protein|nr:hypothetical protein [Pseudobdellovibrionaceae bacterium]
MLNRFVIFTLIVLGSCVVTPLALSSGMEELLIVDALNYEENQIIHQLKYTHESKASQKLNFLTEFNHKIHPLVHGNYNLKSKDDQLKIQSLEFVFNRYLYFRNILIQHVSYELENCMQEVIVNSENIFVKFYSPDKTHIRSCLGFVIDQEFVWFSPYKMNLEDFLKIPFCFNVFSKEAGDCYSPPGNQPVYTDIQVLKLFKMYAADPSNHGEPETVNDNLLDMFLNLFN